MCVLRVTGDEFDPDAYLASSRFEPEVVFRKDEPRFHSRPDGKRHQNSGFNVNVSDAEWDDLPGQVKDAESFLRTYRGEFLALGKLAGIELHLDFPLELYVEDVAPYVSGVFSKTIVQLAGEMGVSIEWTLYFCSHEGDETDAESLSS